MHKIAFRRYRNEMNRRDKVNMKREKWLTLGLIVALVMSPVTDVYAQESNGTYETVGSGDYEESQVDDNRNKESDAKMGQQKIEI